MAHEEEWLKAAIIDDSMVADLLLRLNSSKPALPLHWTVRQRRSKPVPANGKKPAAPRDSPTTPLSWSGAATSVSGGGAADAGGEESSRTPLPFKSPGTARSKGNGATEATTSKRSRRKKHTLAELKEEEISLIKERKQLKKELALLRANLEKQRDTNKNLKRMKLDFQYQQANKRATTVAFETHGGSSGQYQQEISQSNPDPIFMENVSGKVALLPSFLENGCIQEQKDVAAQDSTFVLPDLNLPFEEEGFSTH